MKKLWLGVLAVWSLQSQAVISDRFNCKFTVNDLRSNTSTIQKNDFYVARIPSSGGSEVTQTAGDTKNNLDLKIGDGTLYASYSLSYQHAVKSDASGYPMEARQYTCIGIRTTYCSKGDGGKKDPCKLETFACLQPKDPFDPEHGWSPVDILYGIPAFNEAGLGPMTASISDAQGEKATVVLDCKHLGSYQ